MARVHINKDSLRAAAQATKFLRDVNNGDYARMEVYLYYNPADGTIHTHEDVTGSSFLGWAGWDELVYLDTVRWPATMKQIRELVLEAMSRYSEEDNA